MAANRLSTASVHVEGIEVEAAKHVLEETIHLSVQT
jgi:hypothetical protein